MLLALVTAAIAVVGTLLGSFISGRFQERAAERSVRVNHGETIRRDRLEAVPRWPAPPATTAARCGCAATPSSRAPRPN
ncbi:hypothetical protein ACUN3E_34140 [Streptomyces sp. Ju416(a)]|uniref:hypothetical protein n=1 Tax=Streptomyces sp. Ju416(a) TaxID=3446591 RepID=UPI00403D9769